MVTVRHRNRDWDLELPARIPAGELVPMLCAALQLPAASEPLRLSVEPLGAMLGQAQSLAEAGVLDGAVLVLGDKPSPAAPQVTDAVGDSPALGWRSLAPQTAVEAEAAPAMEEKPAGYSWKKLGD
jgi:uncharacterized ubiquitin-like protein YukD